MGSPESVQDREHRVTHSPWPLEDASVWEEAWARGGNWGSGLDQMGYRQRTHQATESRKAPSVLSAKAVAPGGPS